MRRLTIACIVSAAFAGLLGCGPALAAGDAVDANPNPASQASAAPQEQPLLPPYYRRLVAKMLLTQYISDADGPPEITPVYHAGIFYKTPRMVVRFPLSRTGANGVLFSFQDPPPKRYRCIDVEADRGFVTGKGFFSFRHPRNDPGDICATHMTFEPFTELAQMAGRVQDCRARGENTCVVADAVSDAKEKTETPPAPKKQAKRSAH